MQGVDEGDQDITSSQPHCFWPITPIPELTNHTYESPLVRRQASLSDLKSLWIPSPARTSSQTNIIFTRKAKQNSAMSKKPSVEELKISDVPTPQSSVSSISSISTGLVAVPALRKAPSLKASKNSSSSLSRHKLQSKDSFVDVSACLTRKRHEIMKLWEESISKCPSNTQLLETLEKTNSFGIDAAALLENLKYCVHDMNKGGSKDTKTIEGLRQKVMESLKNFDAYNKVVHELIAKGYDMPAQKEPPTPPDKDSSETIDLTQLNKLYAENFSLSHVKSTTDCKKLQEKFSEQQETVKSLQNELKRVESQYAFDFRLLKSNLAEKIEDISGSFPEILHVTEMKLVQCMSRNAVLEKTLHDKEIEVSKLQFELNTNRTKIDTLTEKLRAAECESSQMKGRLAELVRENEALNVAMKKETSAENILKTIESKLELLKTDDTTSKMEELEEKLRLAKKHIQHQKKTKEDVTNRLTRRVEELMESLDETRQKNHILRNQLQFIRTSYHNLFPLTNVFGSDEPCDEDDSGIPKQLK